MDHWRHYVFDLRPSVNMCVPSEGILWRVCCRILGFFAIVSGVLVVLKHDGCVDLQMTA